MSFNEQQNIVQNDGITTEQPIAMYKKYNMKWYKFLIYFLLFASALANLASGISNITGGIYASQSAGEVTADMVYSTFGSALKAADVILGIATIAIAVFTIYTRFRLAKYKANAPMCICIFYVANAALSLIYKVAATIITGENMVLNVSGIVSIIVTVVVVFLNHVYFSIRRELFIN